MEAAAEVATEDNPQKSTLLAHAYEVFLVHSGADAGQNHKMADQTFTITLCFTSILHASSGPRGTAISEKE